MKRGLFIGRFQPFHFGHLQDITNALKKVDDLAIGIGSSKQKNTKENPFSVSERAKMIDSVLSAMDILEYAIFSVPDFNDDEKWVSHVEKEAKQIDVVYTGNEWTERCFEKKGYKIKKVDMLEGVSSTVIRQKMLDDKDWESLVPLQVVDYINKIKGVERVKKIK